LEKETLIRELLKWYRQENDRDSEEGSNKSKEKKIDLRDAFKCNPGNG
jgi:hypothetical protein